MRQPVTHVKKGRLMPFHNGPVLHDATSGQSGSLGNV